MLTCVVLDLFRRDLTYWECSLLSNSPSSFCHPWKKILNKSDLTFLFLEDRIHGETSSFAPGRTEAENTDYSVPWGWQENGRSGHLSGARNHRFPSSFCWSQRYHVWCDCSSTGPVNSHSHIRKGKKFPLLIVCFSGWKRVSECPA